MPLPFALTVFALSAVAALGASAVLIVRIERIGARLSVTEAALGLLAAAAADSPEIATAITALVRGDNEVGIGVILGSNVAKLAMLLGLAAIVARQLLLDRRAVLLEGIVAVGLALVTLAVVGGTTGPGAGLALALVVFVPYVVVSSLSPQRRQRLPIPARLRGTLSAAIAEEEEDLDLHPRRGGSGDVVEALAALAVVIGASVLLETSGSDLGTAWGWSDLVIGGVLLAIVTSVPNAVAAVYLARRGRGAATLSTTTNSNNINVLVGLLLPAALLGLGTVSAGALASAWWYLALTAAVLAWAFLRRGLTRTDGAVISVAYVVFVVVLLR